MAKRRGNSDLVTVALAGLFILLIFVAPLAVTLFWLSGEILTRSKKFYQASTSLHPTTDEQELLNQLSEAEAQVNESLASLFAEGHSASLRVRQDGCFDERSYLGQSLNRQIEIEEGSKRRTLSSYEEALATINDRRSLWANRLAQRRAGRVGVACYIASLLARPLILGPRDNQIFYLALTGGIGVGLAAIVYFLTKQGLLRRFTTAE